MSGKIPAEAQEQMRREGWPSMEEQRAHWDRRIDQLAAEAAERFVTSKDNYDTSKNRLVNDIKSAIEKASQQFRCPQCWHCTALENEHKATDPMRGKPFVADLAKEAPAASIGHPRTEKLRRLPSTPALE